MASKSDGKKKKKVCFSSMEQPPLIKQLKVILSDYPDGGQILKELIQNAEDAGATEVKILYDGRRINCDIDEETPAFTKFFKGPALCVYNNEVFNEKDWKGIKMINSSMKEEDPLKVGRFGLGFKSVFHITDYPCVVSGNTLLLIDPQRSEQSSSEVNAMIEICEIRGNEDGLDSEAFWTAFDGTFGLHRGIVEDGYFPGTLFWFPLREIKSELSETLYDEEKVMALFQGFESEASSVLIFLKNLELISLNIRKSERIEITEALKVEIENISKVRKQRTEFKTKISSVTSIITDEDVSRIIYEDISNTIQVNVRSTVSKKSERTEWLIVNYYVGSSASSGFKQLITDSTLRYSPYVGVALPLNQNERSLAGHIFCFLPLPREGVQLTGLPVHVNGYFALSQNRHHLKWETDELQGKRVDDKSILWNQFLIKDALPKAYSKLIESAIQISNDGGNTEESIERVYTCLPHSSKTENRWTALEIALFNRLKRMKFLFSESENTWVCPSQATFATFHHLPTNFKHVQQAVVRCLCVIGITYVRVQNEIFDTLTIRIPEIQDLTPKAFATLLRQNTTYNEMSYSEKINVLSYLFSDEGNYDNLKGIELLPVLSGKWKCFNKREEPIYLCPDEAANIFPGLENRILADRSRVGKDVFRHLKNISTNGHFQIIDATPIMLAHLLKETLKLGSVGRPKLNKTFSLSWLQTVWRFLDPQRNIRFFEDIDIVPVLRTGSWESPQSIDLVKLSEFLLVKSYRDGILSEGVCKCFEHLGVTILPSLPTWIPKDKVKSVIFFPTEKGVVRLLQALNSSDNHVKHVSNFNQRCELNHKQEFVSFLVKCQFHLYNTAAVTLLKQLQLFRSVEFINETGCETSVSECRRFINSKDFPDDVRLPNTYLIGSCNDKVVMKLLGVEEVTLECLVQETLECFVKKSQNHQMYVEKFMGYFTSRFTLFQTNSDIIKCASNVAFLKVGSSLKKPSEVFDPCQSTLMRELLQGELLLPEKQMGHGEVQFLKLLGLKSKDDITADIILQVAITLDRWTKEGKNDNIIFTKANALIKLLEEKPLILNARTKSGNNLKTCLSDLYCIPLQSNKDNIESYPKCFEWFLQKQPLTRPKEVREISMCHLVGSTMPTVACTSEHLIQSFKWKEAPPLRKVLDQLNMIKKCYTTKDQAVILLSVKNIYEFLHDNPFMMQDKGKEMFADKEWIWTGHSFASPQKVIIERQSDDIDLRPHFYTLPEEFSDMQDLFTACGCIQRQNASVILKTLNSIRYTKQENDDQLNQDRQVVRNVLDKLAIAVRKGALFDVANIFMMVRDKNPKLLALFPASDCTYNDDPNCLYVYDDSVHIVHEMIPESTAIALGVKSMRQKLLCEAEELDGEECSQEEQVTARLRSLLDGYKDGLSVPKELIQNADDSGASVVKFLYDERQHFCFKETVFSEEMKDFQGPAFFVYNDKPFTEKDLDNIQNLNGATKLNDETKIGKFGVGFCSVYNLTDLPSFITGSNVIFLDPHKKNLGDTYRDGRKRKRKGFRFQLPNKNLLTGFLDQLMPYNSVFGCNILEDTFTGINGTLFRFPLRTIQQARCSQICSVPYTNEEVKKLLDMFINAAGNLLLFSQNIKKLELYHIAEKDTNARNMQLMYSVDKKTWRMCDGNLKQVNRPVLLRVPEIMEIGNEFKEIHVTFIQQKLEKAACKLISDIEEFPQNSKATWITSWAKGYDKSLNMHKQLLKKGAIPLAAVAIPCNMPDELSPRKLQNLPAGFYKDGHAFCFLPLPIKTKLPVQINSCFAVTSDRRQLDSYTEDDKDNRRNAWNNALMEDALVKAHIHLLQILASTEITEENKYRYYDLWPGKCSNIVLPFKESFYKHIYTKNIKVFQTGYTWLSFAEVVYLDPQLRQSAIGDLAFEVVSFFKPQQKKTLVEMPEFVINSLRQSNKENEESIKSSEIDKKDFLKIFLKNINDPFWQSRTNDRNKLVVAALCSSHKDVHKLLRNTSCIPTEPANALRKPTELIHPNSELASLFNVNEEYFPLNTEEMRNDEILKSLVNLGMIDTFLPDDLLLDRCESVPRIAKDCCSCSYDRCVKVLGYLSVGNVVSHLQKHKVTLGKIKDINMLPVLPRPETWVFPWKSESECCNITVYDKRRCRQHKRSIDHYILGKPNSLYQDYCKDYVGMVENIADESITSSLKPRFQRRSQDVFIMLGVKSLRQAPLDDIVEQTDILIEQYKDPDLQYNELQRIHRNIFNHFEGILQDTTESSSRNLCALERLKNRNIVLIGKDLINTSKVAFEMKIECKPVLYCLSETDALCKQYIYRFLGVKICYDIDDILEAIALKRKLWGNCIETDLHQINILLTLLDDIMTSKGLVYADLSDKHDLIFAPDNHSELHPTFELVIENEEFETSSSMKMMHPSISAKLASHLGVKAKEERCFEDMSVGISFGQHENLVTRIHNLLKAYPCDSSIMKELLQNADDAGATEINFIKDYRSHLTERTFGSPLLQGPALCVYNNSSFTQEDIVGIHNLGEGSKSQDPTKTGQYGVGFNAVYHLTDTPSFLTKGPELDSGGRLCILDPLCSHVPKATVKEPGQMCKVDQVKRNFPNSLLGYSTEQLLTLAKGTVFRLPLRKAKSDLSTREEVNTEQMDNILSEFMKEMFNALIFLKNVSCIKVSNITSGALIVEYTVNTKLSQTATMNKQLFFEHVKSFTKGNKEDKSRNLDVAPSDIAYEMQIEDNQVSKRFLVVQKFGFKSNEKLNDLKITFQRKQIGHIPLGGIAFPLPDIFAKDTGLNVKKNQKTRNELLQPQTGIEVKTDIFFKGKAFCTLPLPIQTCLPVHVNGHFILDHEARREICKDGFGREWNDYLMENNIVPAWVLGICYLHSNFESGVKESKQWFRMNNEVLKPYFDKFPNMNDVQDSIWRNLLEMFYRQTIEMKYRLYPHITDRNFNNPNYTEEMEENRDQCSANERFYILWTFVSVSDNSFHGVFDDIKSNLKTVYKDLQIYSSESIALGNILRNLGMQLITSPPFILDSVLKAKIKNIPKTSPEYVMRFLKSSEEKCDGHCEVGSIGDKIEKTGFKTEENLRRAFFYITLYKDYTTSVEGLPVLLTTDNILRIISRDTCVFATPFWKLMKDTDKLFLHDYIRHLGRALFDAGYFKDFTANDFLHLLPLQLPENELGSGKIVTLKKTEDTPLSKEWLGQLYDFLCDKSIKPQSKVINYELFKQNLQLLDNWSFLPVQQHIDDFVLVPFSKIHYAFHLSKSYETDQINVLQKIHLPHIDFDSFSACKFSHKALSLLSKCVASPENPTALLQCLVVHRRAMETCKNLSAQDGNDILSFFERHLESIAKTCEKDTLKNLFKELPLYLTLQGTLTRLKNVGRILLLPSGIPLDGIESWANAYCTTLLKKEDGLNKLYQFLELKVSSILCVYAEHILPTFSGIPERHWMVHITYLRDQLRNCVYFDDEQLQVIHNLKQIAFVESNGTKKRVNEMYCHKNDVFLQMMNQTDFLPDELRGREWERFLEVLGLNVVITDELMLRFATEIQGEGLHEVNDVVKRKSHSLVQNLLNPEELEWKKKTLQLLKDIRFVVSCNVDCNTTDIYPQKDNVSLIPFNHGVPATDQNIALCWSCVCLIPCDIYDGLNASNRKLLGLLEEPALLSVVRHCQNICESMKQKLEERKIRNSFVARHMCYIYDYFNTHKDIALYQTQLQNVPIIHLYEETKMVFANDIVIDLSSYGEVKPYLYRAPVYHGRYHQLFLVLGSQKSASFEHYIRILQQIKNKLRDEKMNVVELRLVQRSLDNMVKRLDKSKENKTELDILYLPSIRHTLVNSKSLTVSNNKLLEKRLDGRVNIDYFIGFPALTIGVSDPVPVFKRLPEHLQPSYLTQAVREVICEDRMQIFEVSRKASHIERFLHADEFVNAICRIVKHQFSYKEKEFTEIHAMGIKEKLLSVNAFRVKGLETVLYYRDAIVIGSERPKFCFHQIINEDGRENINFFFHDNDETESLGKLVSCNDGLAELVDLCTGYSFDKDSMRIATTMMYMEDPQWFIDFLDESNIDAYDVIQGRLGSVFPTPGTYVERRFLPFLEQGIQPFEEHEFESIAMELEDNLDSGVSEDQEPVFIYVRIMLEIKTDNITSDIRRKYVVNTGDPYGLSETVPIYRLYRFVRKDESEREIQIYDEEVVYKVPVDENCRKLRNILKDAKQLPEDEWKAIRRRLLLQWHPDKNIGKEAYCTKVFQYLQIIISRLENGEDIGEDIDEEMKKGQSGPPSTDYYNNINKRARQHANEYKNNFEDYNQGTRSYCHTSKSGEKVKDPREASRWMRQAKKDFETAEEMFSVVQNIPGFNWICYTCHQASEKSLKAAWFYKDANQIPRSSHSLTSLADDLNGELSEQAALLENRLGQHTRMRYPDSVTRPKIPSDEFDEATAEFSIKVTRKIIQLVEKYIC